jgi:Zn-dependent M28 family amino/carboxypeptidase
VNKGETRAAFYIGSEFKRLGLQPPGGDYYQYFTIPVNTLPGSCALQIDGKSLQPGTEFMVSAFSPSIQGSYRLTLLTADFYEDDAAFTRFRKKDHTGSFILIDTAIIPFDRRAPLLEMIRQSNPFRSEGIAVVRDHFGWHVSGSGSQRSYVYLDILRKAMPDKASSLTIDVEAKFFPGYLTQNVIGFIPGSVSPDSFIFITAHYDHLGRMGRETYFPGAHDNASGVAMMADLAAHFSREGWKPEKTLVFVAFGAEEAGLLGSFHYVDNPLFAHNMTRFVLNIDLVGSGSKGIKVVNGTVHSHEFGLLQSLNRNQGYLAAVEARGPAPNSDHFPFYKMGVPAFFIYTMGDEYTEYHTVHDKAEGLPLTEYDDLFRLITDFINSL